MRPTENREARKRWTVLVERQPQEVFRRLPRDLLQRIRLKIRGLAKEPRSPGCKILQGYDNLYTIPVGGWRISYAVEDDRLIVLALEVAPRGDAYRF